MTDPRDPGKEFWVTVSEMARKRGLSDEEIVVLKQRVLARLREMITERRFTDD